MMRSKRRSFRAKKKAVRWFTSNISFMDAGAVRSISSASLVPDFAILAMHQRQTLMTPELVEVNERHTIETIRGDICLNGSSDANLIFHVGIRVVDLLPTGVPQTYSPTTSNEADDNWMFLRHIWVPIGSLGSVGLPSSNIEVHVKSKRRLLPNQALVMYAQSTKTFLDGAIQADGIISFYPYLRTLVSKPE